MIGSTMAEVIQESPVLCVRCGYATAKLVVRTEQLCKQCFHKYVATKISKRMEANKIRGSFHDTANKLLLPLSFGVSSVCLLHVLDQYLQSQTERTGRAKYTLHVLIIDDHFPSHAETFDTLLRNLQQRFPLHIYSVIPLEEIFDYGEAKSADIIGPAKNLGETESISRRDVLHSFLSSLPSASSRSDISSIIRGRLITLFAERQQCSGIVFGDSTTRLAQKTMAETAKGRGGFLPWLTNDGITPSGIRTIYPMRDLLKKEVALYAETVEPSLGSSFTLKESTGQGKPNSKNATIDDLMSQYFDSVEENYPSIVANVVRTSSKLLPLPLSNTESCRICRLPIEKSQQPWIGDQAPLTEMINKTNQKSDDIFLCCYGCNRAIR